MGIKGSDGNRHGEKGVKKSGKKAALLCCIFLSAVLTAAAAVFIISKRREGKKTDFLPGNMPGAELQFDISEGMTLASGVTNVGITEEVFEVENLTTKLEIEEIYVNSEDTIEKGAKVLKLSETSIAEAREELEKALRVADLAYRAGKIEYEKSKITLQYDRDSKLLSGGQAKAVYEETLSGLQDSVEKAKEELEEAKEEIAEYQSYVGDNSYKSYFKVDEYRDAYEKTLGALKDKMGDWGVSWSQVTGGGGGTNAGGMNTGGTNVGNMNADGTDMPVPGRILSGDASDGNTSGKGASDKDLPDGDDTDEKKSNKEESDKEESDKEESDKEESDKKEPDNDVTGNDVTGNDVSDNNTKPQSTGPGRDQIQVLASLYKVLEAQAKKLEQAENDYEEALVNAVFELQTLELKLPELEQKLTEAEKSYQTEILQAEITYEKALASAESAQSDYNAALRKAETNYEKLKSDREDAEENLALFEKSVGDGCFYASGSGTILRMMVRAGEELAAEGIIFVYSNPEEMTVTVSVNQTDIAGIALEDKVYIQTEEHGGLEGVVTKINPISESDNRTNVAYSVVVRLTGDTAAVSTNESVMAVFGMEEKAIREAISGAGQSVQNEVPKAGAPENAGGRRNP